MITNQLAAAQAWLNQGKCREALAVTQTTVRQHPRSAMAWVAYGVALRSTGDLNAAESAFSQALVAEPGNAEAETYRGMILLGKDQQEQGWPLYQARWRIPQWPEKLRYPASALWRGHISPGLRLLMWGEQGFGDIIQFSRYIPWLAAQLGRNRAFLAVEVPTSLCQLFRSAWPDVTIYARGTAHGHFDAHLPLFNLPCCFGSRIGTQRLPYAPTAFPYLPLSTDESHSVRGAQAPDRRQDSVRARVGLVWQGRATHPDDRWRSLPVAALEMLFDIPGIQWVSLQKDAADHPSWLPRDMDSCNCFADTARVVSSLDLVVTIDSAVAHLAAALGRPVWLLLPRIPDWRWGTTGNETPWYPSMRLFRQTEHARWDDVLVRVATCLTGL